jgi:hypothetical protein
LEIWHDEVRLLTYTSDKSHREKTKSVHTSLFSEPNGAVGKGVRLKPDSAQPPFVAFSPEIAAPK